MKERIIKFTPAFDKRSSDPKKNYGIRGVNLGFYLKGEKGTIQFIIYTNWFLPHVMKELKHDTTWKYDDGVWCPFKPLPADVGYHSPVPLYEGQTINYHDCEWTGGACYYDGSGLNAKRVFEILCKEGDEGVWKELEREYQLRFEGGEVKE